MPVTEESLDFALHRFEKNVDRQLGPIDNLSTRTGVVLGFVLTALVAFLAFAPRTAYLPLTSGVVPLILIASGVLLAYSYGLTESLTAPEPSWLLPRLGEPRIELKRRVVADLAVVFVFNRRTIQKRVRLLNVGITLFLIGAVAFVIGALPA